MLIVDLQIPDMNGLELQQHLKRNDLAIPMILITAHGDAAILSQPAPDIFVARFGKPLHDEALFSAINRGIGHPRDVG